MIRAYQDQDLEQLLDVWHEASLVAHPFLDARFLKNERQNIATVYVPLAETWVYAEEDVVVGFISLIGNEVGGLFVYPSRHGKGIGRALMDHARDLRGSLELDVFKENHIGRRFYDRYGFVFVKEHIHEPTGLETLRLKLTGRDI